MALQEALTNLAGAFLNLGITGKEIGSIAEAAFVRAASELARTRTGRVNCSRVSALTGTTRRDVKRLLKEDPWTRRHHQARTKRVIHGWTTDPIFLDSDGEPLVLPVNGRMASFAALVKKYGGDLPYGAVLNELVRATWVVRKGDGVTLLLKGRVPVGAESGIRAALKLVLDSISRR